MQEERLVVSGQCFYLGTRAETTTFEVRQTQAQQQAAAPKRSADAPAAQPLAAKQARVDSHSQAGPSSGAINRPPNQKLPAETFPAFYVMRTDGIPNAGNQ